MNKEAEKSKTPPKRAARGKAAKTVVRELRKKVETKLEKDVDKASLGDYIKLVALEKELKGESTPKEITVTWVDESEK